MFCAFWALDMAPTLDVIVLFFWISFLDVGRPLLKQLFSKILSNPVEIYERSQFETLHNPNY